MPHFRVDDALNNHPKARLAGLEAMGLWSLCGAYCMAYLTDGFVPEWYVKTWPRGSAMAKRLVAAELWFPGEKDGERGWSFHQWRQDSKQQVEADREAARRRKAKQRSSQRESHRDSDGESHRDSARTSGYTHPNPSLTPSVVNSGGGVTSQDAHAAPPPCPDHPENSDAPCRKCRRRRVWEESHADEVQHDQLESKRRQRELAANCPRCKGTNVYDIGDDQVAKCWPHVDPQEAIHG